MGRWVTSKGRHIYIPDEGEIVQAEDLKAKQIEANKIQGDTKNLKTKLDSIQEVDFNLNPKKGTGQIKNILPVEEHPKALADLQEGGYLDFLQKVAQLPSTEQTIPVNKIVSIQSLINKEGVLKSNESTESVMVVKVGDTYYLYDGNHRAAAALLTGKKEIKAIVKERKGN